MPTVRSVITSSARAAARASWCRSTPRRSVPTELAIWEGATDTFFDNDKIACVDHLVALMDRVPAAAELGMHLCYGDISHQHWKEPDLGLMAIVGFLSVLAQLCILGAYRAAPAAFVAPLQYSQILWATLFGWLLFAQFPGFYTWLGAGIVVLAAVITIRREALRKRAQTGKT